MGESVSIQEYIESYVPGLVEKFLEEKPIPGMGGTTFTIQLTMGGEKSLTYGITIADGKKITITPGGVEKPMLSVTLPEELIQRAFDLITPWTNRQRYDAVRETKGALDLEVGMPGDWSIPLGLKFNDYAEPKVKISIPMEDAAGIATGSLNAPMAFMQGKIKMEGDMAFALSLARVLG